MSEIKGDSWFSGPSIQEDRRGRCGDPYVTEHLQSSQKAKGLALPGGTGAALRDVVAPGSGKAHALFSLPHKAHGTGASYAQGVGCGWDWSRASSEFHPGPGVEIRWRPTGGDQKPREVEVLAQGRIEHAAEERPHWQAHALPGFSLLLPFPFSFRIFHPQGCQLQFLVVSRLPSAPAWHSPSASTHPGPGARGA